MRVWWDKRLKWMRVSTIAIVAALVFLLFFAAFTIYGNKVGNFVVNVGQQSELHISLSDHGDLSEQTDRLAYDSIMELSDNTYGRLPENVTARGLGNISDFTNNTFLAYSFYLINNSDRAVDYDMDLVLIDTVGNPLGFIRVMLIEEENGTFDESNRIYALTESTLERAQILKQGLEDLRYYTTEDFLLADQKLFSINFKDLDVGASRRYTVVLWLEGADPDCVNENMGARAKMQLNIKAY